MFVKNPLIFGILLGTLTAGSIVHAQSAGDKHVLDSLNVLLATRTIECDIRIETFVDKKEYTAKGQYVEQVLPRAAPNSFFRSVYRLEITYFSMNAPMASDAELNQMTVVCHASADGGRHQIDRYTSIEGVKTGSTIDLKKLEERIKAANQEIVFSQVSVVRNLGGLAGMMRQINRFYEFATPTQENLRDQETIPTWKLTGTLQNRHRQELLPWFGGLNNQGHYPADFPSDIEIWIGRHNDFPYKIRYLRRTSEKSEQKEMLFQQSFYKVVLNETPFQPYTDMKFAPLQFPTDVFSVRDETDDFINKLGL
jgi:hypothetical protein